MRSSSSYALAVALLGIGLGCSDAPVGIDGAAPVVEAARARVVRGGTVDLRLANPGVRDWGYNLCSDGRLQRLEGSSWVDTPDALIVCTLEIHSLRAGSEREGAVHVPHGIPTGVHRVRVRFTNRGDTVHVTSNPFSVQ